MSDFQLNFLHFHSRRRGRRTEFLFRLAAIGILTLIGLALVAAAAAVPFYRAGKSMMAHVESGRSDLAAAEDYASQLMVGDALHRLDLAQAEFDAAKRDAEKLKYLDWMPYVGERIIAADNLITGGVTALSAVRDALTALREVLEIAVEGETLVGSVTGTVPAGDVPFRDLTAEKKRAILAALERSAPRLTASVAKIDEALLSLDEVPTDILDTADLTAAIETSKVKLRSVRSALSALSVVAAHLPPLLGYPDQKNYLVFFQNNTELRPTGGFLGVFGVAEVKDAELLNFDAEDIYAIDGPSEAAARPAPPAPIEKYVNIKKWYLRDANWSPDFPTSAALMERFFHEEMRQAGRSPVSVDGIIAITPQIASDLLRIVGPVTVGGKTFDADNLVDELEFAVEMGYREEGTPFFARKSVVGDLADELTARLTALPLARLVVVLQALERNLAEGHVLIWMKDANLQALVLDRDWGGALKPVRGDYVSVIDANLAAYKTDHAMTRDIGYEIRPLADGGFEGRVSITYRHGGGFDWKTTRYRTYTRVYVPAGSELMAVEGAMENDKLKDPARRPGTPDTLQELGRTAFGAFISVEPGTTGTLTFRYKLPSSVADSIRDGSYRLDFEKQPGTWAHGLTLDLDFGKNLTKATPPEDPTQFGDTHYRYVTDLRLDRTFEVGF